MMLISIAEYAAKYGKHPDNIRQRILRGNLPAVKIGRNWCIDSETPLTDKRVKLKEDKPMTTYTIKPEAIDTLCLDAESAAHVYTLDEVMTDAENFGMDTAAYIVKYLDVHQDNPKDEDELLGEHSMEVLVNLMDDSIREYVHEEFAPCTNAEFVREYLKLADLVVG